MEIINWKEALLPYEQAVEELIVKFRCIEKEFKRFEIHSPIEQVDGRVKSISSIIEKATKRNISIDEVFDKLEDIAGIRIMCKFVEDIYKVVSLIKQRDGIDIKVIKEEDYITNTKKSGYRSYHINAIYPIVTSEGKKNVIAEIQIRTLAMNFWATIEHSLRYKYNGNIPNDIKKRLEHCASAAFDLDKEMSTIRKEILEAQKVVQTKNNLVNEILKNIQNLYYIAKVEKMNQFNKKFIDLYQSGNIEELSEFNRELETMARLYKVQYV